jgi:hypothetical protein
MESHKKFNSNAISEDFPSYFKSQFVDVVKSNQQVFGKKIFQVAGKKNILTPVNEKSTSSAAIKIQTTIDQDLDSLKLSIQNDITRGYRNTLRFQSNHYRSFFNKVDNSGFNRLTTEITSLFEKPKITRTLKGEPTNRKKYKSLSLDKSCSKHEEESVNVNLLVFDTKPKKKILKVRSQEQDSDSLEEFEKRLKEFSCEKGKNVQELYHTRKKFSL